MLYRQLLFVCLVVGWMGGLLTESSFAEESSSGKFNRWELSEVSRSRVQAANKVLQTYRTSMETASVDQWADEDIDRYYYLALRYLFASVDYYRYNGGRLPYRLEFMAEGKSAGNWPGDPLNDWKPLPILTINDAPVSGGVVWQVCPPEYFTQYEDTDFVRQSAHQLSIYGVDVDGGSLPQVLGGNEPWAVINPGMLATIGHYSQPFSETAGVEQDNSELLEFAVAQVDASRLALAAFDNKIVIPDSALNVREQRIVGYLVDVYTAEIELERIAARLREVPGPQWPEDVLAEYLGTAQWMVCASMYAFNNSNDRPTSEINELVETGYLPAIPINPLNDWQPMRMLQLEEGFSAGNLTYQSCSPNQFSSTPNGPWPCSFEIGVYGSEPFPIEDRASLVAEKRYAADWVVIPDGTIQQFGMWSQTLAQTDYRRAICFT